MSSKTTQIHAKNKSTEMVMRQQQSDAPLLPVNDLERLHEFRPDLVDFIKNETAMEAAARRKQDARVNIFVFIERMTGILAAVLVGTLGIAGGIYVGLQGQPWLGGIIATTTIGTLAVAFLTRPQQKS